MNNTFIKKIAAFTGIALGAFALSAMATWTAPDFTPPNCPLTTPGCNEPINIGNVDQNKDAGISLKSLLVDGDSIFTGKSLMGSALATDIDPDYTLKVVGGITTDKLFVSGGISTSGTVKMYSKDFSYPQTLTVSDWQYSDLYVTLTPNSATSKFVINANLAVGKYSTNVCKVGLFRKDGGHSTPYTLQEYATLLPANTEVIPAGISYFEDADSDTSERTYHIKVKGDCKINESYSGGNTGASTMTVMEIL